MKIICLSGGMDPVHTGHISMIREATKYGNVIIILNSDEWLIKKKGYVFMPWEERAEILRNISGVWKVATVDDSDGTVCDALQRIRPNYFGNGGDRDCTNTPEMDVCNSLGIELVWGLGGKKTKGSSMLVTDVLNTLSIDIGDVNA